MTNIAIKDLPKNWKDKIRAVLSEGGTVVEARRAIDLNRYRHDQLMKIDEYRDIIEEGQDLAFIWWTTEAKKNLNNRNFNNSLFNTQMRNRFKASHDWDRDEETKPLKEKIAKAPEESEAEKLKKKYKSKKDNDKITPLKGVSNG